MAAVSDAASVAGAASNTTNIVDAFAVQRERQEATASATSSASATAPLTLPTLLGRAGSASGASAAREAKVPPLPASVGVGAGASTGTSDASPLGDESGKASARQRSSRTFHHRLSKATRSAPMLCCILLVWTWVAILIALFIMVRQLLAEGSPAKTDELIAFPEDACPCVCQQASLEDDAGACAPGRSCVYGHGWCREASHPLPGLPVVGRCQNSMCGGPEVQTYPRVNCGSSDVPSLPLTLFVQGVPGMIKAALPDAATLNAKLATSLASNGYDDLSLTVDEDLVAGLKIGIDDLHATWLEGCWPPQRFALVSGTISVPRGALRVQAAGLDVEVIIEALTFRFRDVRAEMQCHAFEFVLGALGSGHASNPVDPGTLSLETNLDIRCGDGLPALGPTCLALAAFRPRLVAMAVKRAPELIAQAMNALPLPIPLGPGCLGLLHNTFVPLGYAKQECCEAQFKLDSTGCLMGGQVNGAPLGLGWNVSTAKCTKRGGLWKVRCDTVPGGYYMPTEGTCREDDVKVEMPGCGTCLEGWRKISSAIQLGLWAVRLLTAAVLLLLVTCVGWAVARALRCASEVSYTARKPEACTSKADVEVEA
eukprot:TRINITY_DN48055_c0_g1_i1.p1 TRINITY_DN48055_c0_g1~~TRINITY_DN48055_c0_g1_i1.p1  ORF type:complete len:598 (+),score=122.03 TRINITY_DN48055_c0_g1_i1:111-1904(+)